MRIVFKAPGFSKKFSTGANQGVVAWKKLGTIGGIFGHGAKTGAENRAGAGRFAVKFRTKVFDNGPAGKSLTEKNRRGKNWRGNCFWQTRIKNGPFNIYGLQS
jgi:hypothetical protein